MFLEIPFSINFSASAIPLSLLGGVNRVSEKEVEIAFLKIILFQTFCISMAKTFKSLSKQNELGEKERERYKDRKTEDSSCKRASAT